MMNYHDWMQKTIEDLRQRVEPEERSNEDLALYGRSFLNVTKEGIKHIEYPEERTQCQNLVGPATDTTIYKWPFN